MISTNGTLPGLGRWLKKNFKKWTFYSIFSGKWESTYLYRKALLLCRLNHYAKLNLSRSLFCLPFTTFSPSWCLAEEAQVCKSRKTKLKITICKQLLQGKALLTAFSIRWGLFSEATCMLASFQTLKKDCAWVADLRNLKSCWQLMFEANNSMKLTQRILNGKNIR